MALGLFLRVYFCIFVECSILYKCLTNDYWFLCYDGVYLNIIKTYIWTIHYDFLFIHLFFYINRCRWIYNELKHTEKTRVEHIKTYSINKKKNSIHTSYYFNTKIYWKGSTWRFMYNFFFIKVKWTKKKLFCIFFLKKSWLYKKKLLLFMHSTTTTTYQKK